MSTRSRRIESRDCGGSHRACGRSASTWRLNRRAQRATGIVVAAGWACCDHQRSCPGSGHSARPPDAPDRARENDLARPAAGPGAAARVYRTSSREQDVPHRRDSRTADRPPVQGAPLPQGRPAGCRCAMASPAL